MGSNPTPSAAFRPEVLLLAHTLAPQVAQIRVNAAAMLLGRGEFGLAESVILPLAGTAHEGAYSAMARSLLAKARARDPSGVDLSFQRPPPREDESARPPRG